MGWKGNVRTIRAAARQAQREQERRRKAQAKLQLQLDAIDAVEDAENYIQKITTFHAKHSEVFDWEKLASSVMPVEPQHENKNEEEAQAACDVFTPNIFHKLFKMEEKKRKRLSNAVVAAKAKDETLYRDKIAQYEIELAAWKTQTALAKRIIKNDAAAYVDAIRQFNPFDENTPLGRSIEFIVTDKGNLTANVGVYDVDVIPKEKFGLRQSGSLSKREMPKGEANTLYQQYIASCSLHVATQIFALLPIEQVLVNANGNILNTQTGYMEEQPVLSTMFMRKTVEGLNLEGIDPANAIKNFRHNMRFKKTIGFEPVPALQFENEKAA